MNNISKFFFFEWREEEYGAVQQVKYFDLEKAAKELGGYKKEEKSLFTDITFYSYPSITIRMDHNGWGDKIL